MNSMDLLSLSDYYASITSSGSGSVVGVVLVMAILAWYYLRLSPPKRQQPWLPSAPCSMQEAIQGFAGADGPFFLLRLARTMGRSSFRIPLPVLRRQGAYIVGDPDLTRAILQDAKTDKPLHIYRSFEGISGRKIMFTSRNTDPYLRKMRKSTAHAFSRHQVGRMKTVADQVADQWMNERLAHMAETNTSFDPAYEMNRITFYVICEAGFEYTDLSDQEFAHFSHHIEIALREFTFKQSTNPLRRFLWKLLPGVREALASSEETMVFSRKLLQEYKKKQKEGSASEENTLIKLMVDSIGGHGSDDDADDDEQIAAEVVSWLTAGHDTTGYSLGNALVLLAKHPKVQTKLRHELAANTGSGESPPERLAPYFRHFLRELARFLPVAAMGSIRTTGRDWTTKDGYLLPAGAVCFLPQYVLHRNRQVFGPTVDEFDPDRWLMINDNGKNAAPASAMLDSVVQFSLGSRNCPGQALAMTEIQSLLPKLLAKYEFRLEDEGHLDYFLTLKYVNAKLKARKLH